MKKVLLQVLLLVVSFQALSQEEKYKALFIYKFVKNLEFPEGKINDAYVIGVVENENVFRELSELTQGRKINGKPIVIKKHTAASSVSDFCLLFLSHEKQELFESLNNEALRNSVVLVGDTPGLGKKGAAINFAHAQNRLGFEINDKSLAASNVKCSSSLRLLAISSN